MGGKNRGERGESRSPATLNCHSFSKQPANNGCSLNKWQFAEFHPAAQPFLAPTQAPYSEPHTPLVVILGVLGFDLELYL